MLGRREVVLGGLLTICWGAACPCAAQTARTSRTRGCMLNDDEAMPFLASVVEPPKQVTREQPIIPGSGDKEFDFALAQTLFRLSEVFGVVPSFAYYDDYDGPNAWATSRKKMENPDGTVLFGLRYLRGALAQREAPDIWVTSVCAHEFGHIVQYKRGIGNLNNGQTTVKRSELHADFLAGFYAGRVKLQRPAYPAAVFAAQHYAAGNYNYQHPSFHGTPDERANAVVRGFEAAYRSRQSLNEAIQTGIKYVQSG